MTVKVTTGASGHRKHAPVALAAISISGNGRSSDHSIGPSAGIRIPTGPQTQKQTPGQSGKAAKPYGPNRATGAEPASRDWADQAFGQSAFDSALAEERAEAQGEEVSEDVLQRQAWARVSERLWNSVEDGENRLNKFPWKAQYARSLTIGLPKELSGASKIELMRGYVRESFADLGMIADWVIHDSGDGNPHVHVMLTTREIDGQDWSKRKQVKWNARSLLLEWRADWARHANAALERAGLRDRIDHRSYKERGIKLEAESYSPHIAEHAERAGKAAREKARVAAVRERNQAYLREHPEHILAVLRGQMTAFTRDEILGELARRLDVSTHALPDRMVSAVMASPDLEPEPERGAGGERLYAIGDRRD